MRNGRDTQLGPFGGGSEEIFAGSPAALAEMETFQDLRIAGTVLYAAGLATLIAELVIVLAAPDVLMHPGGEVNPTFYGLLIGGTVTGLTGSLLMAASSTPLSRAVDHYNHDLYERIRQARTPDQFTLRISGRFQATGSSTSDDSRANCWRVATIISLMESPARLCALHLGSLSLALVTTLVAVYGADINRAVRKRLKGHPLLVRTAAFVGLCAFGYGWLGVQLAGLLRRGLGHVPVHFLPLTLVLMYLCLGLLAERKRKI